MKENNSGKAAVESVSDLDDSSSSTERRTSASFVLSRGHEETSYAEADVYYSCDDHLADDEVEGEGLRKSQDSNSCTSDNGCSATNMLDFRERLQRIEKMCVELSDRPVAFPSDRDQLLQKSLNRIKCVECDLENTKRVLHATVTKQVEISEFLENLQLSKCHGPGVHI
ncbi:Phosphatidylinositol/phosphatidylcholine transfer protein SFH13 [Bienertia sinuspersici]